MNTTNVDDESIIDDLMERAVKCEGDGKYNEAIALLREAAHHSRRLAKSRLWEREDSERRIEFLNNKCDLFLEWTRTHCTMTELSTDREIQWDVIARYLGDRILGNREFETNVQWLVEIMTAEGVEFASPGGSIERRLGCILADWLSGGKAFDGLANQFIKNVAFRVAIAPIVHRLLMEFETG